MSLTNAQLAERIDGVKTLISDRFDAVGKRIDGLAVRVDSANGRVGAVERAMLVADTERKTLRQVATQDRQHNADVETRSWTRWQKVLGACGVLCGALAGAGGLTALIHYG
jgi:hypothetical protein